MPDFETNATGTLKTLTAKDLEIQELRALLTEIAEHDHAMCMTILKVLQARDDPAEKGQTDD